MRVRNLRINWRRIGIGALWVGVSGAVALLGVAYLRSPDLRDTSEPLPRNAARTRRRRIGDLFAAAIPWPGQRKCRIGGRTQYLERANRNERSAGHGLRGASLVAAVDGSDRRQSASGGRPSQ